MIRALILLILCVLAWVWAVTQPWTVTLGTPYWRDLEPVETV